MEDILAEAHKAILEANEKNQREMDSLYEDEELPEDAVVPIKDLASTEKTHSPRISTGFKSFDDTMKGGFKDGDLMVVSGISGEGKTSFAQTLTYHLTRQGTACLWFPYETTIEELHDKFMEMGIEGHYFAYAPKINTTGNLDWVKSKIIEGRERYQTKVIFIDHIDFLVPSKIDPHGDSREQMLKQITLELKTLAIELKVIIVLIAHVKKLRDDKVDPSMQDIGYSAGIFQLADYVFMVWRERAKVSKKFSQTEDTGDLMTEFTRVKIVKNRQTGRLVFCKLVYKDSRFQTPQEDFDQAVKALPF